MEINKIIREFIEKNLVIFDEDVEFSESDNIFEMGFVNSLFAMNLITYIEEKFNIIVEGEDMEISKFSSINNIVNFIGSKINE